MPASSNYSPTFLSFLLISLASNVVFVTTTKKITGWLKVGLITDLFSAAEGFDPIFSDPSHRGEL